MTVLMFCAREVTMAPTIPKTCVTMTGHLRPHKSATWLAGGPNAAVKMFRAMANQTEFSAEWKNVPREFDSKPDETTARRLAPYAKLTACRPVNNLLVMPWLKLPAHSLRSRCMSSGSGGLSRGPHRFHRRCETWCQLSVSQGPDRM